MSKGRNKNKLAKVSRAEQRRRDRQASAQLQRQTPTTPQARPSSRYVALQQQQQAWVSPTLPPQVIAQYIAAHPSAGDEFFGHMNREQGHRHDIQRTALKQVGHTQLYTFLISAIGIVCGTIVLGMGQAAGLVAVVPAVIALLQAVWQRHKQDKLDQQQQSQQLPPGS